MQVVTPIGGPVRRVFDQNLQVVVDLSDLVDGGKYLCTSGMPLMYRFRNSENPGALCMVQNVVCASHR